MLDVAERLNTALEAYEDSTNGNSSGSAFVSDCGISCNIPLSKRVPRAERKVSRSVEGKSKELESVSCSIDEEFLFTEVALESTETCSNKEQERPRNKECEGEVSLWGAVLIQGLRGARAGDALDIRWVSSRQVCPGSFVWLCELFSINPDCLRSAVSRGDERIEKLRVDCFVRRYGISSFV